MTPPTTRRQFVAGLGALTTLPLLLAACGEDDQAATSSSAPRSAGPWTFTDDRGEEISLPGTPKRIVAHEYAAVALWDYGIRPVGIYGSVPLDEQPLMRDFDLEGIESVGEVWGEVNLEALAALRPDVIITTWWPSEKLLGGIKDSRFEAKMAAIAPLLGIHAQVPATTTIEHFDTLAGKLGADLEAPELVATRQRFDDAPALRRRGRGLRGGGEGQGRRAHDRGRDGARVALRRQGRGLLRPPRVRDVGPERRLGQELGPVSGPTCPRSRPARSRRGTWRRRSATACSPATSRSSPPRSLRARGVTRG